MKYELDKSKNRKIEKLRKSVFDFETSDFATSNLEVIKTVRDGICF